MIIIFNSTYRSIYIVNFTLPLIFFIDGNWNLLIWKTSMLGSLLNSVLIFAFELYLHFSHLYISVHSNESSLRKLEMHLSRLDSNARLRVMNGLYVTDVAPHEPQVTIVV